jgi:MFS family permease
MPAINKFIRILISADLMFNMAAGFITPVFAIFLVDSIQGGTIKLAGAAVAVFWVIKSTLRVPIAYYLDKNIGEHDDYYSMVIGFTVFAIAHFLYLFARTPVHIYIIQALMGVAGAFAYTPWYGFFTRHIDHHHESFEWSISVSSVGFGLAAAGYISGVIAENYGFSPLFIISGIIALFGVVMLMLIGKQIEVVRDGKYEIKVKK